jgi:hypothetical protein
MIDADESSDVLDQAQATVGRDLSIEIARARDLGRHPG